MTESTTTAPAGARELADNAPKTAKTRHYLPVRAGGNVRAGRLARTGGKTGTRQAAWLLAAVVVLSLLVAASLAIGARGLSLATVWQTLTQFDAANGDHAVVHARIPRTVLGILVGGALGLAGAAMQGVARNPLADRASWASMPARRWPWSPASIFWRYLPQRLHLVRLHRRRSRRRRRLRRRVHGPGRCDAGQARPRRRRPQRRALFPDERHPRLQPGHPGPLPLLAGGRDRRPRLGRGAPGLPFLAVGRSLFLAPAASSTASPWVMTSPAAWASVWA
ncbi:transport system permease protein [Arthrobacter sp. Hiyo4]|nr:transport system permease protein [Arthrobacter sp. Hiyo4]